MARFREDLPEDVQSALAVADKMLEWDRIVYDNIHSVGWGNKVRGGVTTDYQSIVVTVEKKGDLYDSHSYVPLRIAGYLTDVQERPKQEIALLKLNEPPCQIRAVHGRRNSAHTQCYNTPIPGGVEIFPLGRAWLGTLGCKVVFRNQDGLLRHGAITNWHVATGEVGKRISQPGGNNEWFATVDRSPGVSFSGKNYVDLSVLDTERVLGCYAPKTHTVKAEQVTLGGYKDEISGDGVGATVARDGRTLGRVVNGRVVQIGVTVRVGYGGSDVATFYDQFVIEAPDEGFSAPGDSGSMVFEWPSMKPFGLLFAGGGGTTIVSPAEFIVSLGQVTQFA